MEANRHAFAIHSSTFKLTAWPDVFVTVLVHMCQGTVANMKVVQLLATTESLSKKSWPHCTVNIVWLWVLVVFHLQVCVLTCDDMTCAHVITCQIMVTMVQ